MNRVMKFLVRGERLALIKKVEKLKNVGKHAARDAEKERINFEIVYVRGKQNKRQCDTDCEINAGVANIHCPHASRANLFFLENGRQCIFPMRYCVHCIMA